MSHTYISSFAFGDRVRFGDIVGTVIGITFRKDPASTQVQISYAHNGEVKEPFVYEWQLEAAQ